MAKHRDQVLIISTDPAHNLSDAFDQKFGSKPTNVKGIDNLFCMEIDPTANEQSGNSFFSSLTGGMPAGFDGAETAGFMKEIMTSVPGIDEATSFGEILKSLDEYKFDLIIFDTAPTGHTLRLLNFPNILEKGIHKLLELNEKFGGMLNSVGGMIGGGMNTGNLQQTLFQSMETMKAKIEEVSKQFKDPSKTTFVAVCIPEFLSMYETERLAIELAKQEIDIHNIVINQVLFPNPKETCRKCVARRKMQDKYLTQIAEIYDDFHLTINPQLDNEVRGLASLREFGGLLFNGYKPEWQ
jgi:arsenite-transporting ATPase